MLVDTSHSLSVDMMRFFFRGKDTAIPFISIWNPQNKQNHFHFLILSFPITMFFLVLLFILYFHRKGYLVQQAYSFMRRSCRTKNKNILKWFLMALVSMTTCSHFITLLDQEQKQKNKSQQLETICYTIELLAY